jgi:uncharacterized protein (DUF697 family)
MTRTIEADAIIHNHVLLSAGAGMLPFPGADVIALSGVQVDMIHSLCELYEVAFSKNQVKTAISVLIGTSLSKFGAKRLLKFIPGVGSVLGGLTMGAMGAASTYALGELFKAHFESGGTLLDFNMATFRERYEAFYEKGKDVVQTWQKDDAPTSAHSSDIVSRLKDLAQLRDSAVISEEDFQVLKKKVVDGF